MEMMSQDISKITEALAKAKMGFDAIIKNKTVKTTSYSFDYADLLTIEKAITKSLSENGLTVVQPLTMQDGQRVIITMLMHISGQWIKGLIPLGNHQGKMQDAGKEITYFRRYGICSLIGITADDDTDGDEEASDGKRLSDKKTVSGSQTALAKSEKPAANNKITAITLSKEQINQLREMLQGKDKLRESILKHFGKKIFADIESDRFAAVVQMIKNTIDDEGAA